MIARQLSNRYFHETVAAFRRDAGLYLLLTAYCAIGIGYLELSGAFDMGALGDMTRIYFETTLIGYGVTFPLLLFIVGAAHIIHRIDARHRRLAFGRMFAPAPMGQFFAGTLLMFAMAPFRAVFNVLKVSIPTDGAFLHDRFLADLDKALHFGVDPFHWLHALGKSEIILRVIELSYNNLWFFIVFGSVYWVAVSPRMNHIRTRFVACFVLSWAISGTLFAILGSSAGPVYFGAVTGDTARFADLVSYVELSRGQLGSASDYQHYLWDMHVGNVMGLGSGISAFPSMHVAMVTMIALFISEANRKWGYAAWGYVAFTVACSVYLGWHYAVDGYVSIVLTVATHFAVKFAATMRWRRGGAVEGTEQIA